MNEIRNELLAQAVVTHLAPSALAGGQLSPLEIFELGFNAGIDAEPVDARLLEIVGKLYSAAVRVRMNIYGDDTPLSIICGCLSAREDDYLRTAIHNALHSSTEQAKSAPELTDARDSRIAELERQLSAEKKRASAQSLLIKSQEKQLTEFGKQKDSWMEAVSTLDSERKANDVLTRQLAERGEAVDLHDLFRLVLLEEFKNQPSYYNADQIDDAVCKAAGKYVSTAEKHGYSKLYTGPQIPEGYQEPESLDDYLARLEDGEPCYHKGCLSHVTHPCDGCGRIAGKSPQSEGVNHVADPS